jgi:hypothetical protein
MKSFEIGENLFWTIVIGITMIFIVLNNYFENQKEIEIEKIKQKHQQVEIVK